MTTQTKAPSQGLLFSEPSYSETAVWCELTEGIDPAEWARICRKIGHLSPDNFSEVADLLFEKPKSSIIKNKSSFRGTPDSLVSRIKRLFSFSQSDFEHLPLISIGPEKLGM